MEGIPFEARRRLPSGSSVSLNVRRKQLLLVTCYCYWSSPARYDGSVPCNVHQCVYLCIEVKCQLGALVQVLLV